MGEQDGFARGGHVLVRRVEHAPHALAALTASTVSWPMVYHSVCILCSDSCSTRTGWPKVWAKIAQSRWVKALNIQFQAAIRARPDRTGRPLFALIW